MNSQVLTYPFDLDCPIGCEASWLWPSILQPVLSSHLYDWLTDSGSLTARLKQHCQYVSVDVLIEGLHPLSADEQTRLNLTDSLGFVREVLLKLDGIPWVFARTVMPLATLTGAEQYLARLGNNSLGSVLFNAPDMQRSAIEIAQFDSQSPLYTLGTLIADVMPALLFGRRSCFLLSGKPLLVSEVFLPAAAAYQ